MQVVFYCCFPLSAWNEGQSLANGQKKGIRNAFGITQPPIPPLYIHFEKRIWLSSDVTMLLHVQYVPKLFILDAIPPPSQGSLFKVQMGSMPTWRARSEWRWWGESDRLFPRTSWWSLAPAASVRGEWMIHYFSFSCTAKWHASPLRQVVSIPSCILHYGPLRAVVAKWLSSEIVY